MISQTLIWKNSQMVSYLSIDPLTTPLSLLSQLFLHENYCKWKSLLHAFWETWVFIVLLLDNNLQKELNEKHLLHLQRDYDFVVALDI